MSYCTKSGGDGRDSNRLPPACKAGALPIELHPLVNFAFCVVDVVALQLVYQIHLASGLLATPQKSKFTGYWWAWEDLNLRPHAYQACALTNWATSPRKVCLENQTFPVNTCPSSGSIKKKDKWFFWVWKCDFWVLGVDLWAKCILHTRDSQNLRSGAQKAHFQCSLERRWSSRRFPYGYLVTTSPQSSTPPWSAASLAG